MLKSLILTFALVAGIFAVNTANAQRAGDVTTNQTCTGNTCTVSVYTWTYNPFTGTYQWVFAYSYTTPRPKVIER